MSWTWDESEEIRVVYAEHVVELEGGRETELVKEGGHDFWVIL